MVDWEVDFQWPRLGLYYRYMYFSEDDFRYLWLTL